MQFEKCTFCTNTSPIACHIPHPSLSPLPPSLSLSLSLSQSHTHTHTHTRTHTHTHTHTHIHQCPRRVNAGNKNTPSLHHPQRWNVTTYMVGLGNGHICQNLTQNGEPRDRTGECRRRRMEVVLVQCCSGHGHRKKAFAVESNDRLTVMEPYHM